MDHGVHLSRLTPLLKAPSAIKLGELPKTSTGKVKKYELRNRELVVPADA